MPMQNITWNLFDEQLARTISREMRNMTPDQYVARVRSLPALAQFAIVKAIEYEGTVTDIVASTVEAVIEEMPLSAAYRTALETLVEGVAEGNSHFLMNNRGAMDLEDFKAHIIGRIQEGGVQVRGRGRSTRPIGPVCTGSERGSLLHLSHNGKCAHRKRDNALHGTAREMFHTYLQGGENMRVPCPICFESEILAGVFRVEDHTDTPDPPPPNFAQEVRRLGKFNAMAVLPYLMYARAQDVVQLPRDAAALAARLDKTHSYGELATDLPDISVDAINRARRAAERGTRLTQAAHDEIVRRNALADREITPETPTGEADAIRAARMRRDANEHGLEGSPALKAQLEDDQETISVLFNEFQIFFASLRETVPLTRAEKLWASMRDGADNFMDPQMRADVHTQANKFWTWIKKFVGKDMVRWGKAAAAVFGGYTWFVLMVFVLSAPAFGFGSISLYLTPVTGIILWTVYFGLLSAIAFGFLFMTNGQSKIVWATLGSLLVTAVGVPVVAAACAVVPAAIVHATVSGAAAPSVGFLLGVARGACSVVMTFGAFGMLVGALLLATFDDLLNGVRGITNTATENGPIDKLITIVVKPISNFLTNWLEIEQVEFGDAVGGLGLEPVTFGRGWGSLFSLVVFAIGLLNCWYGGWAFGWYVMTVLTGLGSAFLYELYWLASGASHVFALFGLIIASEFGRRWWKRVKEPEATIEYEYFDDDGVKHKGMRPETFALVRFNVIMGIWRILRGPVAFGVVIVALIVPLLMFPGYMAVEGVRTGLPAAQEWWNEYLDDARERRLATKARQNGLQLLPARTTRSDGVISAQPARRPAASSSTAWQEPTPVTSDPSPDLTEEEVGRQEMCKRFPRLCEA